MKKVKVLIHVILLLLLVTSIACSPKYKIENGQWAYITFDEAAGKRIRNISADIESFKILEDNRYGKDKNNVFFQGRVISKADPHTFEIISNRGYSSYSKDKDNVYLDGTKIALANPNKFVPLDWPYAKDDRRIFCGTLPIEIKDVNEFRVTESSVAKTSMTLSHFLKSNKEFTFLDSLDIDGVIYGNGKGETKSEKFESYKKLE